MTGPLNPPALSVRKTPAKSTLPAAELDHDVALQLRAVLGAEAADVFDDRFQLLDRILAGVMDDVPGVVPDREVLVADGA
jgi:hypothetical protein